MPSLSNPWVVHYSGARFSKVPKLYGPFLGVLIRFVSQERSGLKSSNFTVIFIFVTLKTRLKIGFPKQAVGSFTNGFSGPKSFRVFEKRAPGLRNTERIQVTGLQVQFNSILTLVQLS